MSKFFAHREPRRIMEMSEENSQLFSVAKKTSSIGKVENKLDASKMMIRITNRTRVRRNKSSIVVMQFDSK